MDALRGVHSGGGRIVPCQPWQRARAIAQPRCCHLGRRGEIVVVCREGL